MVTLIPSSLRDTFKAVHDYVFYTQNCVFQVIYVLLVVSGHLAVINDGLLIVRHYEPEESHLFWPLILLVINMVLFLLCSYSNPGMLDKDNCESYVQTYPYDDLMYKADTICKTCNMCKPARSKHCSVCNRCIYKFDHYCVWISNAVGGNNHRYFLLLLTSLAVMCIHGAYATFKVLKAWSLAFDLTGRKYVDVNGDRVEISTRLVIQILCSKLPRLCFVEMGLIVLSCIVIAFLIYHVYLAAINQTTNERYKAHNLRKSGNAAVVGSFYSRGLLGNLLEEFHPLKARIVNDKKTS